MQSKNNIKLFGEILFKMTLKTVHYNKIEELTITKF